MLLERHFFGTGPFLCLYKVLDCHPPPDLHFIRIRTNAWTDTWNKSDKLWSLGNGQKVREGEEYLKFAPKMGGYKNASKRGGQLKISAPKSPARGDFDFQKNIFLTLTYFLTFPLVYIKSA